MALNKGLLTSNSDEWTTPRWLFNRLNERFQFTIDVAATRENRLCDAWFDSKDDGLSETWEGQRVWCNPPYSRIADWAEKFTEAALEADLIVALVPARVDTAWWQDHIAKADFVHFIRGRLRFGDSKNSAPFPSALAFWFGLERICRRPKGGVS